MLTKKWLQCCILIRCSVILAQNKAVNEQWWAIINYFGLLIFKLWFGNFILHMWLPYCKVCFNCMPTCSLFDNNCMVRQGLVINLNLNLAF